MNTIKKTAEAASTIFSYDMNVYLNKNDTPNIKLVPA